MTSPEAPNPERKSDNALLCFCIGVGLMFLAWFLGVGTVMTVAFTGGDPAAVVGGAFAAIGLVLAGFSGFVLAAIGGVWMFVRVLADQREGAEEKRYRDVER